MPIDKANDPARLAGVDDGRALVERAQRARREEVLDPLAIAGDIAVAHAGKVRRAGTGIKVRREAADPVLARPEWVGRKASLAPPVVQHAGEHGGFDVLHGALVIWLVPFSS